MRTLIAEDDAALRELLQIVLEKYGACELVENGEEAVDAFKRAIESRQPFDLICMDIIMPQLGGLEALHKIRRFEKERGIKDPDAVKVIMATALSDSKDVIEALYKGGASAYFVKPIDLEAFVQELKDLGLLEDE